MQYILSSFGGFTVTTIHYLSTKVMGQIKAQNKVKVLMMLFEIAAVNRSVIDNALTANFTDFEDAVIYQAARHAGEEAILTRDPKGFKRSELPIYTSDEMLKVPQSLYLNSEAK